MRLLDDSQITTQIDTWDSGGTYDVRGDLNLDGDVNTTDYNTSNGNTGTTLARGVLSDDPDTVGNRNGYAGYVFDDKFGFATYHVRNRWYNASLARWLTRDPAGYVDGASLYGYAADNPINRVDDMGLMSAPGYLIPETKNCRGSLKGIWSDPLIQLYLEEAEAKCDCLPKIYCKKCSNPRVGGMAIDHCLNLECPYISLCINNQPTYPDTLEKIIIHELVHVRQFCEGGGSLFTICEEAICREVEAYDLSEMCRYASYSRRAYERCLCRRACASVPRICKLLDDCESKCKRFIQGGKCNNGHYN